MLLDELTAQVNPFVSERARLAWRIFIENTKLFQVVQFKLGATDDVFRTAEDNTSIGGRAEGGSYTGDLQTPNDLIASSLLFMGYKIYLDESRRTDARLGLRDFSSWLISQITENSIAFAEKMEEYYFKGSGSSNIMKGLSLIINGTDPLPGFDSETGFISATNALSSGDSFDLENQDNWGLFVRFMRRLKKEVRGATHWVGNSDVMGVISAIADEKRVLGSMETAYGTDIDTFLGLPIVDVHNGAITNDEPDTAGTPVNETSSIYLMANAEGRFHLRSNSGFYVKDVDEMDDSEKLVFTNEIRAVHEIRDKRSVRRIAHFKVSDLAA